ncbi:hypothetical protein SAMN06265368_3289 [Cohaesibacter gelatinilyticus]|uniref:Uncharacterized protein n=1 Tax=Cohaesibacter gelatinilyticus TaxID=372072 RepID=A0A285PJ80_9HYPH|nr:hypothetical protein SAMN06265368_3289 [Cohaesibacter gelatinilyticus]
MEAVGSNNKISEQNVTPVHDNIYRTTDMHLEYNTYLYTEWNVDGQR